MTSPRSAVRRGLLTIAAVTLSVAVGVATAAPAAARDFDRPATGFANAKTVLKPGRPQSVGLDPAPIEAARAQLRAYESSTPALYPGAVAMMGHEGRIVATEVSGYARLYADATTVLPPAEQVPMREDTIFDLASVSKLFTSLAVVQLVESGDLALDDEVASYLPEFASEGKQGLTIRNLLTHTSALPAWLPLWSNYPDRATRIRAVLHAVPTGPPDSVYRYSDLNLITLGVLVEQVTGQPLDTVVAQRITAPLGMRDTGYRPSDRRRTAATEFQSSPARGVVWGEVHDENAWSLGGVAGHAGVFSTAHDLAILSQALLNGGSYRGQRILRPRSVELLITNFNTAFEGDDHGLGFELNQRWYAGGLAGPREAGHTGFTGTSLVIDFASRSFAILLTNRVHPSRAGGSINVARRDWAQGLALAMPVAPRAGRTAWFTGIADNTTATLDLPLRLGDRGARATFAAFVDAEQSDPLRLETSADGGKTWRAAPFLVRDRGTRIETDGAWAGTGERRWVKVEAALPAGDIVLRWRHSTDAVYLGRGVYVDDIQIRGPGGYRVDAERQPSLLTAAGWRAVRR